MRSMLVACPMIVLALAAAAQSIPSVPKLPTGASPAIAAPSVPSPSVPTVPGVGASAPGANTSVPAAGQASNPLEKAQIEAECKIPTNATKPECIKLMLNK